MRARSYFARRYLCSPVNCCFWHFTRFNILFRSRSCSIFICFFSFSLLSHFFPHTPHESLDGRIPSGHIVVHVPFDEISSRALLRAFTWAQAERMAVGPSGDAVQNAHGAPEVLERLHVVGQRRQRIVIRVDVVQVPEHAHLHLRHQRPVHDDVVAGVPLALHLQLGPQQGPRCRDGLDVVRQPLRLPSHPTQRGGRQQDPTQPSQHDAATEPAAAIYVGDGVGTASLPLQHAVWT